MRRDPFVEPRPLAPGVPPATTPRRTLWRRFLGSLHATWGGEMAVERFGPTSDHGMRAYGFTVWHLYIGVLAKTERLPRLEDGEDGHGLN